MNYLLTQDQTDLVDGVARILSRRAGSERAITLGPGVYDDLLHATLADNGYFDVARGPDTGFLEAALVVGQIVAAGGVVTAGASAIVGPALLDREITGPVALADRRRSDLVRFATAARTVIGLDGTEAVVLTVEPGEVPDVRSTFGVPVGRIPAELWSRGERLARGAGHDLLRWWRVAIAVEQAALASAALRTTVAYVNQREQFGHPIAAFQAVRHRLAECAVLAEGARWLALEAAALGAPPEAAAAACAHATVAARHVAAETHQLTGAIGFTKEYALHVFTTRAQGLALELGGVEAHGRAVAQARWGEGQD